MLWLIVVVMIVLLIATISVAYFSNTIKTKSKPRLINYNRQGCPYAQKLRPIWDALRIPEVELIDYDVEINRLPADITGVPTIVLEKDGRRIFMPDYYDRSDPSIKQFVYDNL